MEKEIEKLIKIKTLRDVEIKMRKARLDGLIIPEETIVILRDLEIEYIKPNEIKSNL